MDWNTLYTYLKAKPGAAEEFPFDDKTMVFKVGGKMFTMASYLETPVKITLTHLTQSDVAKPCLTV